MDLRVTLLAVPPLLPTIHAQLQLDEKGVAALSSLPVLLLGAAAVPGSFLVARIGARRALLGGLAIIAVASVLRGLGPSVPVLFAMTFLMGTGIALSQPTMPALVRQWFPGAVTRATGVWSNGLLVGELLGAALTLPLVVPLAGGSWEVALSLWAIPVALTVALVALGTRHALSDTSGWRAAGWPNWRQAQTWQLGLLQSSASLIYFGANTFLPDYLHANGQPYLVGPALTAVNLAQVPASFVVGLLPWRLLAHRGTAILVAALILVGVPALLVPNALVVVGAAGLLGFVSACILVVCLALPALLGGERDVARLAAGGSTIGYTAAFLSNLLAGALWDAVPAGKRPGVLASLKLLVRAAEKAEAKAASSARRIPLHAR